MLAPMGPGRNNAFRAMMSSKESGFIDRISDLIAAPSIWNTPIVSPDANSAKVAGSSSGTESISTRSPVVRSISSRQRSMIESVERPRKSILSSPRSSTPCISNCVTVSASSPFLWTGTMFVRGSGAMTTAAAWIESCLRRPSSPLATSTTSLTAGSVWYISRSPCAFEYQSRTSEGAPLAGAFRT